MNNSKVEMPFQKEKRLKSRKQIYKETYKKGVFLSPKEQLIKWIEQDDVLVRFIAGGVLDDDTEFCQVTVEGFKA